MLEPRTTDIGSFQLLATEDRSVSSLDPDRRASAEVTSRNSSRSGPWVRVPRGAREGAGSPAAQSRATAKVSTGTNVPEAVTRGLRPRAVSVRVGRRSAGAQEQLRGPWQESADDAAQVVEQGRTAATAHGLHHPQHTGDDSAVGHVAVHHRAGADARVVADAYAAHDLGAGSHVDPVAEPRGAGLAFEECGAAREIAIAPDVRVGRDEDSRPVYPETTADLGIDGKVHAGESADRDLAGPVGE